jgi:hypothetical protein
MQRSGQQGQRSNQYQNQHRNNSETGQRSSGYQQNRQGSVLNTPTKNNNTTTPVQPSGCFKCGELATMLKTDQSATNRFLNGTIIQGLTKTCLHATPKEKASRVRVESRSTTSRLR